jgi:hypothetical protein
VAAVEKRAVQACSCTLLAAVSRDPVSRGYLHCYRSNVTFANSELVLFIYVFIYVYSIYIFLYRCM